MIEGMDAEAGARLSAGMRAGMSLRMNEPMRTVQRIQEPARGRAGHLRRKVPVEMGRRFPMAAQNRRRASSGLHREQRAMFPWLPVIGVSP